MNAGAAPLRPDLEAALANAVVHLGGPDPAVRLGGVFGHERVYREAGALSADAARPLRRQIVATLCAVARAGAGGIAVTDAILVVLGRLGETGAVPELPFDLRGVRATGLLWGPGAVLPSVDFSSASFDAHVALVGSELHGELSFREATFSGEGASFRGTIVQGFTNFAGARCAGRLDLDATELHHGLHLVGAAVDDTIGLEGATVRGDLFARGVVVRDWLDLGSARVHGLVTLDGAQVGERLVLAGAHLQRALSLRDARIHGGLLAEEAVLDGVAVVDGADLGDDPFAGASRGPSGLL